MSGNVFLNLVSICKFPNVALKFLIYNTANDDNLSSMKWDNLQCCGNTVIILAILLVLLLCCRICKTREPLDDNPPSTESLGLPIVSVPSEEPRPYIEENDQELQSQIIQEEREERGFLILTNLIHKVSCRVNMKHQSYSHIYTAKPT